MNYHFYFEFKLNPPSKNDYYNFYVSSNLDLNFDSNGLLYVNDFINSFQIFTESGQFIFKQIMDDQKVSNISNFCFHDNSLYIVDKSKNCLQKYNVNIDYKSKNISFLHERMIYKSPDSTAKFHPYFFCIGPNNLIYISNPFQTCILVLDLCGKIKFKFNFNFQIVFIYPHQNTEKIGLCFGPNRCLYVSIPALNCIQVFDEDGHFKFQFSLEGSIPGQFNQPGKICFSPNHLLYVHDKRNNRIQIFDQNGIYQSKIEFKDFSKKLCNAPTSFAINPNGSIYIYSTSFSKIIVLQNTSSRSLYQILAFSLFQTKNNNKKIRFY